MTAAGWRPLEAPGFSSAIAPLWTRGDGPGRSVAFVAGPHHSNTHIGTVHGGVLMTFADIVLGLNVADLLGAPLCVTAQLQLQFVSVGRIGSLVIGTPEVVRQTRSLVFMRGLITADGETIASADGIWKILAPR